MEVFYLRRAIERLRDGLFDTVAVNRLTMEEEQVMKHFSQGLKALDKGKSHHLCICGSYGQGKSHNLTYLHQQALSKGYAASMVQLDLRETPLHQFHVVYQTLMTHLTLPGAVPFVEAWKRWAEKGSLEVLSGMPHRFQMILKALLAKNMPAKQKGRPKGDFLPKEFSNWLEKALMGYNIPLGHLKHILQVRGIEEYRDQSLRCLGNLPYVQMVEALGTLLREMGYKGLLLFFDEAESIAQVRSSCRAKSYEILQQLFHSKESLFPIFAFTEGFFDKVQAENYEDEKQTFSQNYAEAWKDLTIVRLEESSAKSWETLQTRLIQLYAEAYQIDLSQQMKELKAKLHHLLDPLKALETRFKLKALVNQLDIETQSMQLI